MTTAAATTLSRTEKALVLGRIGLVRSLGREGIPVVLAREGLPVLERASRYCKEFLCLPSFLPGNDTTLRVLERYGALQTSKPVVFLGGEYEVLFFSQHRERLREYYRIVLPPHELICNLIDKGQFAALAEKHHLPVPKTRVPRTREEFFAAADEVGFPCILKPLMQRLWHQPEILAAVGPLKAILLSSPDDLRSLLDRLPPRAGGAIIQEYVPGDDSRHFDFHAYFDQQGEPRGHLVAHKLRTYPIHFGMGCYAQYAEEPSVSAMCLDALRKIGYAGPVDVDVKRHARTGKDYILEINPRFSLLTVMDWHCGVNLPLLQYCDAVGLPTPVLSPRSVPRRWLWLGADLKSLWGYWKAGELTPWQWLRSFRTQPGKIEFHVFAWDDPLPLLAAWWYGLRAFLSRAVGYSKRRLFRSRPFQPGRVPIPSTLHVTQGQRNRER